MSTAHDIFRKTARETIHILTYFVIFRVQKFTFNQFASILVKTIVSMSMIKGSTIALNIKAELTTYILLVRAASS